MSAFLGNLIHSWLNYRVKFFTQKNHCKIGKKGNFFGTYGNHFWASQHNVNSPSSLGALVCFVFFFGWPLIFFPENVAKHWRLKDDHQGDELWNAIFSFQYFVSAQRKDPNVLASLIPILRTRFTSCDAIASVADMNLIHSIWLIELWRAALNWMKWIQVGTGRDALRLELAKRTRIPGSLYRIQMMHERRCLHQFMKQSHSAATKY